MAKGNKHFRLVENKYHQKSRPAYDVYLKSTGELVANVNQFGVGGGWRFNLANYPHNHSKVYGSLNTALVGIEKEVL